MNAKATISYIRRRAADVRQRNPGLETAGPLVRERWDAPRRRSWGVHRRTAIGYTAWMTFRLWDESSSEYDRPLI